MTSFIDKVKNYVAREIARDRLPASHNYDDILVRSERWRNLAEQALPEVEDKINAMTNIEFLELLSNNMENAYD